MTNVDEERNSTSTFIEVNDVACTLLGYERAELLKMKSSEITAPEDRDVLSENIHQIIK